MSSHNKRGRQWALKGHRLNPKDQCQKEPRAKHNTNAEQASSNDQYEELFATVMAAKDPTDDRAIHEKFKLVPSNKVCPIYCDVIEKPMDLRLVANKIQAHAYSSLLDMERDLLQMTKNACLINEPDSQVYKDAKKLRSIFTLRRIELEMGKGKPAQQQKNLSSAAIAALKRDSEGSDVEYASRERNGPLWSLFDFLNNVPLHSEHPYHTGPNRPTCQTLANSLWHLPARRFHPEYFELIKRPISMCQIFLKLKEGEYDDMKQLTADLYLMLDNAKKAFPYSHYSHKDAVKMEFILINKLVEYSPQETSDTDETYGTFTTQRENCDDEIFTTIHLKPKGPSSISKENIIKKILSIQKCVIEYTVDNRRPIESLMDYPPRDTSTDYCEIIQNRMDISTIERNIRDNRYATVEDFVADYQLMFSNCRQYNLANTWIHDDAIELERVLNKKVENIKKREHREEHDVSPDAILTVEELCRKLFTYICNHRDGNGCFYCDSLNKLPKCEAEGEDVHIMFLKRVQRRLVRGVYKRLDVFQEDIFACMERARLLSPSDSKIFQDSIELQTYFIRKRDKLCKDILSSPALRFTVDQLMSEVEVTRLQKVADSLKRELQQYQDRELDTDKQQKEDNEDDTEKEQDKQHKSDKDQDAFEAKRMRRMKAPKFYSPGDYVYVMMKGKTLRSVGLVGGLWTTPGLKMNIQITMYLRPCETHHTKGRKFFENELLQSTISHTIPMDSVLGLCYVLHYRDFVRMRPLEMPEEDIFICDTAYNVQERNFKKIKNWKTGHDMDSHYVKFVARDVPLKLKRTLSAPSI